MILSFEAELISFVVIAVNKIVHIFNRQPTSSGFQKVSKFGQHLAHVPKTFFLVSISRRFRITEQKNMKKQKPKPNSFSQFSAVSIRLPVFQYLSQVGAKNLHALRFVYGLLCRKLFSLWPFGVFQI
ncbi:CLUMA_CG014720, isoform A [Clunio marinus]|uniref:CLUMA_CG014720, isoform A n=1 Tax=Clunio marinus TaxID=568069 RepID=A0A1J1IPG0_9DIPT|nr:CLUMA_CG014720, isoform A [Clunio marinus]